MKKLLVLFLTGLTMLGLVGCGNNNKPTTDPGTQTPVDNTVVVAVPSFNGDFMYGWGTSSYDAYIRYLVYGQNSLLTIDQNGEMIKNFYVDSYEVSNENLKWTFNLKKGIKYSDGTELKASDILFTYKFYLDESYMKAGGSGATARINNITGAKDYAASCEAGACDASLLTGITVVDDYTIEFDLDVCYYATWYNTFGYTPILSEAYFTQWDGSIQDDGSVDIEVIKANAMQKPFGLGAYAFVEFATDQYVKLAINPYFDVDAVGQKPSIETIIVKCVADEVELDQLLAGDIDMMTGEIDAEKINPIKANSEFVANGYPRHGYGLITWHTDFGVTQYTEVRQALAYALDRETFAQLFMGEYGTVVDGPFSTVYWMIDDAWVDANLTHYKYDPAKVAEILEGAGWAKGADGIYAKDGEKMIIRIACGTVNWVDQLNLTTAKVLEECGIKFEMEYGDFSGIVMKHMQGNYAGTEKDRVYNGFALGSSLDAVFDGFTAYSSTQINPWGNQTTLNNSRFNNARNDELLATMRNCNPSTPEGNAAYQAAYQEWVMLMNEELPVLPMYSCEYYDLYNARIKNFKTSSMWDWTAAIVGAHVE